jgi:hypothetical protein
MAVELSLILRFETEGDAYQFLIDVESEFECDIVTNEPPEEV